MSGWSPISIVSLSRRGMMSVLEHTALQGGRVVFDHPDVGWGRAVWSRQSVRIERRARNHAGVSPELLDEPRIRDVFEKQRLNALAADLSDQFGEGLRRGLAVGVEPFGRQKRDPIGLAVIGEGTMAGDDPPHIGRDLPQRAAHLPVERLEFGFVCLAPLAVSLRM